MGEGSSTRRQPRGMASAAFVGVVAGLVAVGFTVSMPNRYISDCRILPVESKGSGALGSLASLAANFGASLPGAESGEANFVDIVNSRWMRDQLLDTTFDFHARSWMFGADQPHHQTLRDFVKRKNADRQRAAVAKILTAGKDPKTKVLTLTRRDPVPRTVPGHPQTLHPVAGGLCHRTRPHPGRTEGHVRRGLGSGMPRLSWAKPRLASAASWRKTGVTRRAPTPGSGWRGCAMKWK